MMWKPCFAITALVSLKPWTGTVQGRRAPLGVITITRRRWGFLFFIISSNLGVDLGLHFPPLAALAGMECNSIN
jgi:hypothetical protein